MSYVREKRTRRRTKESSEEKGDLMDDVDDSKDKYNDEQTRTKEDKEKGQKRQGERTCCMMLRTAAKTAPLPGGGTEWRVRLSLVIKKCKDRKC